MEVKLVKDAVVLTPNLRHKNFTYTDKVIPAGTILQGETKLINGLRRGEPFTYKVFITKDNQFIYNNTIEPMATEVIMNADGERTVVLSKSQPANSNKALMYAATAGVAAYFISSKGLNNDQNKSLMIAGATALIGYFIVPKLINK